MSFWVNIIVAPRMAVSMPMMNTTCKVDGLRP